MYIPPHFAEHRTEEIHRIITSHPLGVLVVNGPAGLDASHIPFDFDAASGPHGSLLAHIARRNPLWQDSKDGDDVMVIFRGTDAYVSPNWYPSKHEFHRQVPTWNYQVVHVHGKLRIRDDEKFLRRVVARLTRTHEARSGQEKPWKMGDSEPEYIDRMLAAIVGIEIDIERFTAVSKLNQHKDERDRLGVVQGLQGLGQNEAAEAMLQAVIPPRS